MATNDVGKFPEHESIPGMPMPYRWWCHWKALKGTNPRRLTIPDADLRNEWIILTGGNSGIGFEAALQFVKWGANIIIGCRQPPPHEMHPDAAVEKLQAAALAAGHGNAVIEWWECDMSSFESVEAFGQRWLAKDLPLHILANNAGMPEYPGRVQFTKDGFEILHQVNFLSHVLLTLILLPSLARALQPRIICTTSCMQYLGVFDLKNANEGGLGSYPHNKLYFQTWLTELQARMLENDKYKHIVAHGIHPGYTKTNIFVPIKPQEETKSKPTWGNWLLGALLNYVGIDAQQGSLAITNTATAPEWGLKQHAPNGGGKFGGEGARYSNRIWDETPAPQTKHPGCRLAIWNFVADELKLEKKGLLTGLEV